jgi:hypothetical protein
MTRTSRKQAKTYNGFAIPLQPDTELGLAMLIAEDEEGHYEPVAVVVSIAEGMTRFQFPALSAIRSQATDSSISSIVLLLSCISIPVIRQQSNEADLKNAPQARNT